MDRKVALRLKLRKLDFQALEIFYNLYVHQNVTEVSEILFLSQSSVSYSLNRLRTAFNDQLFINSKGGMKPTAKSESIIQNIEDILGKISVCVDDNQRFSPEVHETTFTIFCPEYFEILVVPLLIKEILKDGLKITIETVRPEMKIPFEEIENHQIDVGIVLKKQNMVYPHNLCSQSILHDELLAVFDSDTQSDHPLTIEEFVQYKHIFPSPWLASHCLVDNWLKGCNTQRTVIIKANGYYSGLKMLASSDMMMMMLPRKIYQKVSDQHSSLRARELPQGFPGFELDMIWSKSSFNNQANEWIRKQIIRACQRISNSES